MEPRPRDEELKSWELYLLVMVTTSDEALETGVFRPFRSLEADIFRPLLTRASSHCAWFAGGSMAVDVLTFASVMVEVLTSIPVVSLFRGFW